MKHLRGEDESRLGGEGVFGTGHGIETTCVKCGTVSTIQIVMVTHQHLPKLALVQGNDPVTGGSICGGWKQDS